MLKLLSISNFITVLILITYWFYSETRYQKLLDRLNESKTATLNVVVKPIKSSGIVSQNDSIILYEDSILALRINKHTNRIKYRIKLRPIKVKLNLSPKGIHIREYDTTRANINILNNTKPVVDYSNKLMLGVTTTFPNRMSLMLSYRKLILGISPYYYKGDIKLSPVIGVLLPL